MSKMNKLANAHNRFQMVEKYPRVLCVCSAGLLRSPTVAWLLSNEPFNFNTRAVGASSEYACIEVDAVLLSWADYVVYMEEEHKHMVFSRFEDNPNLVNKKHFVLNVPDNFPYRDPELVKLAMPRLKELFNVDK